MVAAIVGMNMADCTADADRVNPREDTTVKHVKAPVVPLDEIKQTLQSQRAVNEVRSVSTSDFVAGAEFQVDIVENCSFQLRSTLRDLGLYIESVETYDDHETLHLKRMARLLERMDTHGRLDYPDHPSER